MASTTLLEPRWSSPLETVDGRILPTHGPEVCAWIEANCILGEGDYFGQPMVLDEFERWLIYRLYEYYPETGLRRYKKGLFGLAKGNGKSPLAAAIAAYELCGEVNDFPHVIVGAASFDQADLVFGDLTMMVSGPPDRPAPLSPYVEVFDREILLKGRAGKAERIAAMASTNDGARATCFIGDELHEWTLGKKRVYLVVTGAVAKRKNGFSLGISTAGVIGEESAGEELYDYGCQVAKGFIVDDAFLFVWYEADENADLSTDEGWEKAVRAANPAYDSFLDIDHIRYRFKTIPTYEFARYHLNRWTASSQRWIPLEAWNDCQGKVEYADGDTCYVGIDAANKRDTSSVAVVFPKPDGKFHITTKIFVPPGGGEVMDPVLTEDYIRELAAIYDVRSVSYDPQPFQRSAQMLLEEGIPMLEVPQNVQRMGPAAQALYDAVLEGRLVHDGGKPLSRQVDAAIVKLVGQTAWMLDKRKATRPIDAVVALAMAMADAVLAEGSDPLAAWA